MALWHQIRRSGIQHLVLYSQNPNFLSAPVRSFAVPAHVKAKLNAEPSGPRINGAITAAYVRLVSDQGHGVVSRREALDRAKQLNLDLVEVQRTADPPVCKIMDFHKEKFKQEEKEKERTKSKSTAALRNGENKEVRFTAKTELKDLKMKAETIIRLMERGYRVKCTVLPASGKEEEDLGRLLPRILALIDDVAVVESGPHVVDKKQAYIIMRHAKFTTKKSGKKAIKALDAVNRAQSAVQSKSGVDNNIQEGMAPQASEWEPSDSETESKVLFDHVDDHNIQQSGIRGTNYHEEVFGFDAKRNPAQNINSGKPSYQKPSPSKPVLDSLRPKQELNKNQTNLKSATASQPEPSVVEVNRYAKQSEPKRYHQNRERMSHQATGNESDTRVQFDPKQRQFNNSSNPSSPKPGYGRFSSANPAAFVDQNKLGHPIMGKVNDPRTSAAYDQNPGGPNVSKPIFISTKPVGSTDQSSKINTADKPINTSNPSSPTRSYGIFSATKPVGSGDQSSKDATQEKTGNTSSASPSYGIFSKSKAGSSGA